MDGSGQVDHDGQVGGQVDDRRVDYVGVIKCVITIKRFGGSE